MDVWAAFRPTDLAPVVVLFTAAAMYCVYHYLTTARRFLRWRAGAAAGSGARADEGRATVHAYVFQRLGGVVCLGLVPLLVATLWLGRDLASLGLRAAPPGKTLLFAAAALAALVPIIYLAARRPAHQARFPEMRLERWSARDLATNAWSWIAYLLAYELFFRGFLLFALVEAFGVWPGIAAMTALYVLAHLPKDAGETFGCLFMGVVFSWMTLETGAIWAAFVTHVGIALASDLFALRANPSMRAARRS